MKRLLLLLTLVVAVGCGPAPGTTSTPAPQPMPESTLASVAESEAWPAPDFTLRTAAGHTVTLSSLRGQWVLVNFWATWCGPCVSEMPYLESLSRAYEDRLTVLGVNMREEPEAVETFAREHSLTFPLIIEPDDQTLLDYLVTNVPLTVVIDPQGEIARRVFGPLDLEEFGAWLVPLVESQPR